MPYPLFSCVCSLYIIFCWGMYIFQSGHAHLPQCFRLWYGLFIFWKRKLVGTGGLAPSTWLGRKMSLAWSSNDVTACRLNMQDHSMIQNCQVSVLWGFLLVSHSRDVSRLGLTSRTLRSVKLRVLSLQCTMLQTCCTWCGAHMLFSGTPCVNHHLKNSRTDSYSYAQFTTVYIVTFQNCIIF